MPIPVTLPASRLHATFDPGRIPWEDSRAVPLPRNNGVNSFQPRAMQALNLALQISAAGYNVYLSGEADMGRSHLLLSWLRPRARKSATPPDLVYVHNFKDPDRPVLLIFPAGQGKKFRQSLRELIENIQKELTRRFEATTYVRQHTKLLNQFQNVRMGLLHKMNSVAVHKGFTLDMDDNGALTLHPLVDGKRLSEEEFDRLDNTVRLNLKRRGDSLVQSMAGFMRRMNKALESFHDNERGLEQQVMTQVLAALLTPVRDHMLKICFVTGLGEYFAALHEDILKNTEAFLARDGAQASSVGDAHAAGMQENIFYRYEANLFVDNSELAGVPIVVEDHPTAVNLLGCVERESEMGALVTNFTLIKAGSLHRANGGFLLLHVENILQHLAAWEGLLRALHANTARIEDMDEIPESATRPKGITPDPLPLNLKVLLIGGEEMYETLLVNDDRFSKLFRIKAHLADAAERNAKNIRLYLKYIAGIISETGLCPFDRSALAWLIDLGSHLCEDQRRLSLKFPLLREVMIEAAAIAALRGFALVSAAVLEEAYAGRTWRANLVEEIFMEEYDRELIKVRTSGSAVGQVNGLSVTWHGDFEFGLPHRISCTVGVGHEGIIDLEREAELGGPIHTKAMMILKSYLTNLFAQNKPLILSGSLYFEQSYAGIEGDSASGAELAALLSALADVPVRLDLAFTGAVSHSGQILPVGGVTRKIEGFYKVCARHGLTGSQGVIIPADNVDHLMLAPDVLDAVEQRRFAIWPVRRIEEALFLLTGLSAGQRRKNGGFTPGSLYELVDKRLERLGAAAQNAFKRVRRAEQRAGTGI
ncbi:ATP-binding protein [Candidatus Desulfovibrio trichonymphae]|uniref:endopeptidase La n=1 Tax=Candidatus Desulfovibrio trichonymphae TaxID=1725232 RepID=A0A1J1DQL7_9BACT|nr:ATP-binding protein [Candidatus Desulfovibrio trichonymphae]BAV92129.1 ATP-dependent protease La homolog [Candidatus Desulfovibrio trichonymphae]GHU92335.1 ATP-dependent protease [Deltaproteobacteria bacterium]